jgi:hypothetical protein
LFTVVHGWCGGVALEPNKTYHTQVGCAHYILECPGDDLMYNTSDQLYVQLTLRIKQHKNC